MNKARRATMAEALEQLRRAHELVELIKDEEREAYDNMPEGLQASDGGQEMEATADALESAADSMQSAIDDLEALA